MNYTATARSNYFRVKDEQAFRDWARLLGMTILTKTVKAETFFGLVSGAESGWPSERQADNPVDLDEEVDVHQELAEHLKAGEVAVLIEIGREGDRYYVGIASAVHSNGSIVTLHLDDIYALAGKAFNVPVESINACQY